MQPLMIAHRGASAYAKENTLVSFDQAIALGADMVEFDVRRTRDRVLIVHHDAELNQKPIRQLTYAQVQAIDPDIPTVEAAIALCKGRVRLDVELKEAGYERQILELLLRFFSADDFVVTSFHPFAINTVKRLYPNVKTGFLFGYGTVDFCRSFWLNARSVRHRIREIKADFIAPHWELLNHELLSQVVTGTMPIWVWTVNDVSVMAELLSDSRIEGIITDKPDLGVQLRDRPFVLPALALQK